MSAGIILCSRLDSKRISQKAIVPIGDKPALWYLFKRLESFNLPIIVATPHEDLFTYIELFQQKFKFIKWYGGAQKNVLERMVNAAKEFDIDPIIRITHDDLFIDKQLLEQMLDAYQQQKLKYVYCSKTIDGVAGEIISRDLLISAYEKHKNINIEHISYFVKEEKDKILDFTPLNPLLNKDLRLCLDYPMDHLFLDILSRFEDLCDTNRVVNFIESHKSLTQINELPKITVFITCFNGSQYLKDAIESVRRQTFKDFEFYFVDDGSTDDSLRIACRYEDIKVIVNSKNEGIAFSSNRVLERAKGKYVMRLDSDDVLMPNSLQSLYQEMETNPMWAVGYSGYFETDEKLIIQKEVSKNTSHHIAGSLMRKKAINEIRFKEGLRHFDSQEIFLRIMNSFHYGYVEKPLFFYRQHSQSWSHNFQQLKIRVKVRRELGL